MTYHDKSQLIRRRRFLWAGTSSLLGLGLAGLGATAASAAVPLGALAAEPLEIGHQPQFLFDLYAVDCTWGLRSKGDPVKRVFHPPTKHKANPVLTEDNPSWLWTARDAPGGTIHAWYQANQFSAGKSGNYATSIAYARSDDGVHWERPVLDLFPRDEWPRAGQAPLKLPRNAVLHASLLDPAAAHSTCGTPMILDVPEKDRRGYRYLMFYKISGMPLSGLRLIGSQDGIHWDPKSDFLVSRLPSDHPNAIVHDPQRQEYVMFCRAKHIYRAINQGREMIDCGESRRGIARMTSRELWTEWTGQPQTILVPDEVDAATGFNYFMAMPVWYRAGIYWGFLEPFRWNDLVYSELAWSRDGIQFHRLPGRPKLIEFGPEGSWDDSLIFACPKWIEMGDQWYIYYSGWDGPHDSVPSRGKARTGAVGLATIRKEGFVSLRAPKEGGVVCTRSLRWPGGSLLVNAAAAEGELSVRISDELRRPIGGLDYPDCIVLDGDSTRQEVRWKTGGLEPMAGRVIRIEFLLKNADLYTFGAAPLDE